MKPATSTLLREEAVTLSRQIEADAQRGNAYALRLLPHVKQLARMAVTNDEGVSEARSLLVDPYGRNALEKAQLRTDRAALRHTEIVIEDTAA